MELMGINAKKIPEFIQILDKEIADTNAFLDKIEDDFSTRDAYRGAYSLAVSEYIRQAKECCKNVATELTNFEAAISEVSQQYLAASTTMASDIRETASTMTDTYKARQAANGGAVFDEDKYSVK